MWVLPENKHIVVTMRGGTKTIYIYQAWLRGSDWFEDFSQASLTGSGRFYQAGSAYYFVRKIKVYLLKSKPKTEDCFI